MNEIISSLLNPNMPFFRYALFLGVIGSVAFGVVGTWVVARRLTALSGAISHAILGGIGVSAWLHAVYKISWVTPMLGAVVAAIISAGVIALVGIYAQEREDAVINSIWAIGMATGLLFLGITPGYVDFEGYLLGNMLLVTKSDLWMVLSLDVLVLGSAVLFFQAIKLYSFDPEFAAMRGIKTNWIYFLMLIITALTIVVMVNLIGIILVIALLTLPAATSGHLVKSWGGMMAVSSILCILYTAGGLSFSYVASLPSGPVIVLLAALVYVLVVIFKHGKKAVAKRRN